MNGWKAPILSLSLLLLGGVMATAQEIEPLFPQTAQPNGDVAKAVPVAPTNLQAIAVSSTRIVLVWDDRSNNETGFLIEGRVGSGTYQALNTTPVTGIGVVVTGLTPGTTYTFRVRATNSSGNSSYTNEATATTLVTDACTTGGTAMCLNNNRFRVQAAFLTSQGQSGDAQTVKLTDDSGYLWFFSASNIEAVVKVLNGCGLNSRYWFFAGGLTNVRVVLTVTDTTPPTGSTASPVKVYVNPQGNAFLPIQDTNALQSCP